ncbi:PilW family protein [Thalassotalea aquiviva]|uniref:PilW family protein n=1 Tax=Thalassotalea aquiviva TaxID=3242415 RepID=UPI00352AD5A3
MSLFYRQHPQHGFSLVEVMIALTLGLFILAIAIAQIVAINRHVLYANQDIQLDENARFVQHLLSKDIKQARLWRVLKAYSIISGSANLPPLSYSLCPTGNTAWARQIQQAVYALNDTSDDYQCVKGDDYLASDILTLRGLQTPIPSKIDKDEFYLRSRGLEYKFYRGSQQHAAVNNFIGSSINRAIFAHSYYIGKTKRQCRKIAIPALYWQTLTNGRPQQQELVSGVEQLQLMFSIDSDQDSKPDMYAHPHQISQWHQVKGIYIELLLRSECPITDVSIKKNFQLGDKEWQFNDSFLRRKYQFYFRI